MKTLTRLSSKVKKTEDIQLLKNVFGNIEEQRTCILLIDEVYVKPALMYHGGTIFGKAVNEPSKLANTVLSFFIVTLFGGPRFLLRMLQVGALDSTFLFEETQNVIDSVKNAGGRVISIISDNNRVNQACFKCFDQVKPWLTKEGIYLLFDFVHILKSIRNNWITERTQELEFPDGDITQAARWSDLIKLFKAEEGKLVKPSKLTDISVFPKPVERQKVTTCLKIFSEETVAAFKTNKDIKDADGTISFIEKIINFWKIVNCKGSSTDVRFRDPMRAPMRFPDDSRLSFLLELADMADKMKSSGKRRKMLTKDTASALAHTCRGFVDLVKHFLATTHEYVLLGIFTPDFLEKMFGKPRQGSGGTYFIAVQQVLEKMSIHKAKLLLHLKVDVASFDTLSGHLCENCKFVMDNNSIEVLDNLPTLEISLPIDVKETLVYIAGYMVRKDESKDGAFIYFEKFGDFTEELSRGWLAKPNDTSC